MPGADPDPDAVAQHLAIHAPGPSHDPSTLVSLNLWMSWAAIAGEHAAAAAAARERALAAPLEQVPFAHEEEFRAALVAITARAFALDAFYLAVRQHVELPAGPIGRPRSGSLMDTLERGFALGGDLGQTRNDVQALYVLRNRAVHHDTQFRRSVLHPSGRLYGNPRERDLQRWQGARRAHARRRPHPPDCIAAPGPRAPRGRGVAWRGAAGTRTPPTSSPASAPAPER